MELLSLQEYAKKIGVHRVNGWKKVKRENIPVVYENRPVMRVLWDSDEEQVITDQLVVDAFVKSN